jgi:hypothetical protein
MKQKSGSKVKTSEFAGFGTLLQAIGVLLCFVMFPIGLVGGVILLVYGSMKANVWKCSECRGNVDKKASICRHCGTDFDDASGSSGNGGSVSYNMPR